MPAAIIAPRHSLALRETRSGVPNSANWPELALVTHPRAAQDGNAALGTIAHLPLSKLQTSLSSDGFTQPSALVCQALPNLYMLAAGGNSSRGKSCALSLESPVLSLES